MPRRRKCLLCDSDATGPDGLCSSCARKRQSSWRDAAPDFDEGFDEDEWKDGRVERLIDYRQDLDYFATGTAKARRGRLRPGISGGPEQA